MTWILALLMLLGIVSEPSLPIFRRSHVVYACTPVCPKGELCQCIPGPGSRETDICIHDCIGNDYEHSQPRGDYVPFLEAMTLSAFGVLLTLYGVWNLQLGPQDWRGFVALLGGCCCFGYGFNRILDLCG